MSETASDWITHQVADHISTATAMHDLVPQVRALGELFCATYGNDHTVFTFGNGGSAADAQHFTGELIGHYKRDRRPLPAVTLSTDSTTMTCIANDYSYDDIFSRQVTALAKPGDLVVAFTTSGKSPNIVSALEAGRAKGATTILFGGGDGGPALAFADHAVLSPSTITPRIQEMHTLMLHIISEMVDAWAAGEEVVA